MHYLIIVVASLLILSCGHDPEPAPIPKPTDTSVKIGTPAKPDHTYRWVCGKNVVIDNVLIAQPTVKAKCTSECEETAETICGKAVDKVTLHAFNKAGDEVKCP